MRNYNIASDLIQVKSIQPVVYKQYDNGDSLEVELFEDGEKIILTDEVILAFFELESGTVIQKNCTINENGNAVAVLDNNILSIGGKLKVEFTIYQDDNETTTRTILINVENSIDRNEAIETIPQWDIVQQVLDLKASDGTAIEEKINILNEAVEDKFNELSAAAQVDSEVILARGNEANLKARLDKTDAQLADIVSLPQSEDTISLQAAISKGGKISLKKGKTYIVNARLTIPDNTEIDGNFATIKRADAVNITLLKMGTNCVIKNLIIDGNKDLQVNPTWSTCIEIETGLNSIVENVVINNGNEAIVSYYDNVTIRDCKITNCGGNGIHFSGSNNTHVDHCFVKNTNLKSGMGHEDGCIIWSNECQNITCTNNTVENGISGFGSIDSIDDSNVKIIGNTILNCRTSAFDLRLPNLALENIIITNNRIFNSKVVDIWNTQNPPATTLENAIFSNNIIIDTIVYLTRVNGVICTSNIIKSKADTTNIILIITGCNDIICANNLVEGGAYGIYVDGTCSNITVNSNTCKNQITTGIRMNTANPNVSFSANKVSNNANAGASYYGIVIQNGCKSVGNELNIVKGAFGILAPSTGGIIKDNIIKTDALVPSIKIYGGSTGLIVVGNVYNTDMAAPADLTGNTVVNNYKVTGLV